MRILAVMTAGLAAISCVDNGTSEDSGIRLDFICEEGVTFSKATDNSECDYIVKVPVEGGVFRISSEEELKGFVDFGEVNTLYHLTPGGEGELHAACSSTEKNEVVVTVEPATSRSEKSGDFNLSRKYDSEKIVVRVVQAGDPGYDKNFALTFKGRSVMEEISGSVRQIMNLIGKKENSFLTDKTALGGDDTDLAAIWNIFVKVKEGMIQTGADKVLNPYIVIYSASADLLMSSYFGGMPVVRGQNSLGSVSRSSSDEVMKNIVEVLSADLDEGILEEFGFSTAYLAAVKAKAFMELAEWQKALECIAQAKESKLEGMLLDLSDLAYDEVECKANLGDDGKLGEAADRPAWKVPFLRRSGLGEKTFEMTWQLIWPVPRSIVDNYNWLQNQGY